MKDTLPVALRAAAVTIVLTGIVYPAAVWAVAQAAFPRQANGSFVTGDDGTPVGSDLLGQPFAGAAYIASRPSAATTATDGNSRPILVSGGSNLGPTSKALRERVEAEIARLRRENPGAAGDVPADLVTASGSGLDPHLSPAAVAWQVPRVAAARGVAEDRVRAIVEEIAEDRDLGFLGEPRVNVLALNRALDRRFGKPRPEANMPPR